MKISFIGGGNMAQALIGGIVMQDSEALQLHVVEPVESLRDVLQQKWSLSTSPVVDAQCSGSDVIVLAVKPQQMQVAVAPLVAHLDGALVISIAAGLRLADLSRWLGGYSNIVRTMPNTPALIAQGMTGLFAPAAVSSEARELATRILSAIGRTVWVETEAQIDVITGISGSGPAYVFYFIEALESAGLAQGLSPDVARTLAIQTCVGAASLAAQSQDSPAKLRENVTSKGGTTAAALAVFEAQSWAQTVQAAVQAAVLRGHALGEALGAEKE